MLATRWLQWRGLLRKKRKRNKKFFLFKDFVVKYRLHLRPRRLPPQRAFARRVRDPAGQLDKDARSGGTAWFEDMYYVYVIRSLKDNRNYIGYTNDLSRRLQEHNRGKSKSVKYRGPFELIYYEEYTSRVEAIHREKQIKNYKGGEAFKKLINSNTTPSSSLVQDTCLSRTRHEFESRRGR